MCTRYTLAHSCPKEGLRGRGVPVARQEPLARERLRARREPLAWERNLQGTRTYIPLQAKKGCIKMSGYSRLLTIRKQDAYFRGTQRRWSSSAGPQGRL